MVSVVSGSWIDALMRNATPREDRAVGTDFARRVRHLAPRRATGTVAESIMAPCIVERYSVWSARGGVGVTSTATDMNDITVDKAGPER